MVNNFKIMEVYRNPANAGKYLKIVKELMKEFLPKTFKRLVILVNRKCLIIKGERKNRFTYDWLWMDNLIFP